MKPVRYRWEIYAARACVRRTTFTCDWKPFFHWSQLLKDIRYAGTSVCEALRVEYSNGQQFVFKRKRSSCVSSDGIGGSGISAISRERRTAGSRYLDGTGQLSTKN